MFMKIIGASKSLPLSIQEVHFRPYLSLHSDLPLFFYYFFYILAIDYVVFQGVLLNHC